MAPDQESPIETPPRVFISYSHDSVAHKQAVGALAVQLRKDGIDILLDQWDMTLGGDLGQFMEKGVTTADRVLVICTPTYCKKANEGLGGVGYEKTILTQELMSRAHTDKFVPVVFAGDADPLVPTCLGSRLRIDMRKGIESTYADLIADLHRQPPASKPPIGKNPFAMTATGAPTAATPVASALPKVAASLDPITVYDQGIALIRAKDNLGWRHLARDVRSKSQKALLEIRPKLDALVQSGAVSKPADVSKLLDSGLATIAPLFSLALAGVESGEPRIEQQGSTLDDVVNIAAWNRAGYTILGDFPINLGFVYHYLHGAMAMSVRRMDLALGLARSAFSMPDYRGDRTIVSQHHGLTGWTPAFESHATHSWQYLRQYVNSAPWIAHVFGSSADALACIAAYGFSLTTNELSGEMASALSRDRQWKPQPDSFSNLRHPAIPLHFVVDDDPAPQRGYQLFMENREGIPGIWNHCGVPDHLMPVAWNSWMAGSQGWLRNIGYYIRSMSLPHAGMMSELGLAR